MVYLIQFWFIQEKNLYIIPRAQYLTSNFEIWTQENKDHMISNAIGLTSFGFYMKKL
jgi:hypothetical protein